MIPEIDNASCEKLRRWWLDIPERFFRFDSSDPILDEIAYALSKKDPDRIAFLTQYAYSEDLNRRASAICFLADKTNGTPETEQILRDAFFSGIPWLQIIALQGFINTGLFLLTKDDIVALNCLADARLPAWGMTYLCYAFPDERFAILKTALVSENPRVREFACDVIGDEFIQDLKADMAPLIEDTDPKVAESAKYNYFEMLD